MYPLSALTMKRFPLMEAINGKRFIVSADSGCKSSTISTSELECRWDDLFAPGSKVRLIDLADPVAVSMYAHWWPHGVCYTGVS